MIRHKEHGPLFTIRELLDFAKKYDANGQVSYIESRYQGYAVVTEFLEEIGFKIDPETEFPYAFGDHEY